MSLDFANGFAIGCVFASLVWLMAIHRIVRSRK